MFSYQIDDALELRSLQLADTEELFALVNANRAYLRTWLPWLDHTHTPAATRDFIQATLDQFVDTDGFVAAIRFNQNIVGVIGYNHIDWQSRIGRIGYWLSESCQGQGIMTTACHHLVDHAFTTLNLNRLVITCATHNHRSRSIPKRLGFHHEGTAREAEWLYDHFVDHEIYALLSKDWPG